MLFCSVGAALWVAVAHGFHPRKRWSFPTGVALAGALVGLMHWERPREEWLLPISSLGAGALVALLFALAAEAVGRRLGWISPRAPRLPSSPVGRLWRGDLHLLASVGSLLVWLAAVLWAGLAVDAAPIVRFPRLVALAIVGLWITWPIGTVAGLIGVWRSTRRDALHALWRPFAWLARAGILAGWALAALVAAVVGPDILRDDVPLAFGRSERERYALRVLRGGTELEFSGEMGFGLTDDVRSALDANPQVRILHLDSGGGRVMEERRLSALVRERRLATYVASECQSACVGVLAAGEPRLLGRDAVIGLHRASPRWGDRRGPRAVDRRGVERLVALGVDKAFAEQGAATPYEEMWRPSHREVFDARLATRYARDDEVAISGLSTRDLERLPLSLREAALFQVLFEFERPLFDRWVAAVRDGQARGISLVEAVKGVNPDLERFGERAISQDAPRASARTLRAFVAAMIATMREDRAAGPERCAGLLTGRRLGRAPGQAAPPRGFGDALAALVASARLEPVAPTPLDTEDPDLIEILALLEAEHPGFIDLADDPAAAARDGQEQACLLVDGIIGLYQALLELPADRGIPLLRGLLAEGSTTADDGEGR